MPGGKWVALGTVALVALFALACAPPGTPTPTPSPRAQGIHTTEDMRARYERWPEEYKFALDGDTVVLFAYPSPIIDWAGFAFINHMPWVSSVTLGRPISVVLADGTVVPAQPELEHTIFGERLTVRSKYNTDEARARLEGVLADEEMMRRILQGPAAAATTPTPPDPATRDALGRIGQSGSGIGEVVPGFGGFSLDPKDNSIAYVYMLDPSQQALAEEAARIMVGNERFARDIREVRVLRADYSISQLNEWYGRMRSLVWSVQGLTWTDLDEGHNRIAIGMKTRRGALQDMERILTSLGIPLDAVNIHVGSAKAGQPYQPSPLPSDPVLRSLRVWVEAPSEVASDVPVPLVMRVKNVDAKPVQLEYGLGHQFVVTRPDGTYVWSSTSEMGIIDDVGRILTLGPGEEISFNWEWRQWDDQGEPVPPGSYLVYGVFDAYPEVPAEPVMLSILP